VCTDTVGTALMGYNPRAPRLSAPFLTCDNMLLLAEQLGVGSADLGQIDVRGAKLADSIYRFG
jgi:hypothetical protein